MESAKQNRFIIVLEKCLGISGNQLKGLMRKLTSNLGIDVMNILVLNYEYPPIGGGGAAVTKELCNKISEHGNQVDVVTMGFKELPSIEKKDNVTVHRVKCWRTKQRVCHPWEQLSYCIRAYKYIVKELEITKYDFIHCHFIIPTGLVALFLKKKYGIRYILTAHGSDVIGHNNDRFSLLYKVITPGWKKIVRNASIITAPSQYLVNKIHQTVSDVEVELVPNGINVSDYYYSEKKKSLITLTRLQKSKGVQDLINACAELDLNGWEINILGDGPYRGELEKIVREKNMAEKVRFRGHVEGDERMKYLSQAGGFFSGSRFEAFSLSVLEASLCGCNIIATNIEPHVLLVGEEHTYASENELKKKLETLFTSDPLNYEYKNERYDWENIYLMYDSLYCRMRNE